FVARVVALRAQREAPHLPHEESALLLRINHPIPPQLQGRYDELIAKRRVETLTAEEHAELRQLTDQVEQLEADRATALVELARLRQVPVAEVMRTLGIQSPTCV
ncbi:MAG: STAS/SEC14 domain-containing protein, partial [Gammaproteobacteria bacterium]